MPVPRGSTYRAYLSRIRPRLLCGCSHDTPRTYADTAPVTAHTLCNGHHLARCAHLQGQTFSAIWQVQRLAFYSPVAGTPPAPLLSPSRHHRQSPIYPCAAPPVAQSSWCLHLPASIQRDLQGQGMEWKEEKNIIYLLTQIPSTLLKLSTCLCFCDYSPCSCFQSMCPRSVSSTKTFYFPIYFIKVEYLWMTF